MKRSTWRGWWVLAGAMLAACSSTGNPGGDGGGNDVATGTDGASDTAPGLDARTDTGSHPDTMMPADRVTPIDTGTTPDMGTTPDTGITPDTGTTRDSGTPCGGACATGFTCTAAGYCANAAGVPAFGHVYVIMMENHSLGTLMASSSAGYINTLMTTYAYATAYDSVAHPSLTNYIGLTAGSTLGIGCDCLPVVPPGAAGFPYSGSCGTFTCRANPPLNFCNCPQSATGHLGDVLDSVSVEWRNYGEGMGAPCTGVDNSSTNFAARHVPFLYYDDVLTNAARCQARVRDFTDFPGDLAAGTYRFSLIAPNLCHDMHDACGGDAIQNGDDWLSTTVPTILAAPGFQPGGTDVLFVVWDEQDVSALGSYATDAVPMIAVGPLVRRRATTGVAYNHYSLLATILDGLGAPRIAMSATAMPIGDIWR